MKQDSDGLGGRLGPAYDTISQKNLEKLKKVKSPKVKAGHYKLFDEKLDLDKVTENLENWNPSHFKPFVSSFFINFLE